MNSVNSIEFTLKLTKNHDCIYFILNFSFKNTFLRLKLDLTIIKAPKI